MAGDEAGVRAVSVLFAVATLPVLYALGRRLFDRRTAVLAALLLGVNVSFVGYARDARSYALVLLLVTASSFFLVRAVQERRERDAWLYAACAGLAVWAHLLAGLVVLAHLAWLALERRAVPRRLLAVSAAGVAALVLPLALALLLGGQGAQLDWLGRPGVRQLPGLFDWLVESRVALLVYFAGAVVALVAGYRGRERRPVVLLLLWLLVPPAAAFVLSYAADPLYLYRYFLVCLPALVLLVAAGLARLRPTWLGVALATVAIAFSVRTVEGCRPDCKIRHDDWEAAVIDLRSRARPGDAIVVYPAEVRTPVDHYLGRDRPELLFPARWGLSGVAGDAGSLGAALRRAAGHPRVWLVTWWLPSEPARAGLRRRARLVGEREFAGDVRLELYRPRARS